MVKTLEGKVQELGQPSLREASVPALIKALEECNVNTMWIQEEPELQNWESRPEQIEEVMIGDAEFEVRIVLFPMQRYLSNNYLNVVRNLAQRHRIPRLIDNHRSLRSSTSMGLSTAQNVPSRSFSTNSQ